MPLRSLQRATLGEKHKHINKLVQDAVNNEQYKLTNIDYNESDVHNILQIDIACKTRNVDYIIEAFKCDDMLYVSRAIKHSTWLITEQEYAHIINPEYLHAQLFPHMLTKAINKLLLHIRLHLKDEKRVEQFHKYLKAKASHQWLLNCSTAYIENVLQNECITFQVYKRLCRRSNIFFKFYKNVQDQSEDETLTGLSFMLNSNTEEFLNVLDTRYECYAPPSINKKNTESIMKNSPERFFKNFERYISLCEVDVPTVVKYIKKEDLQDFLFTYVKKKSYDFGDNYDTFKNAVHFIEAMPEQDRFEFVKKMFIDKNAPADVIIYLQHSSYKIYQWYQHAPFSVAFIDLKKLIHVESLPAERCAILSVLISCTRNNPQDIKTLLEYYYDKHRNEPFKIQFVNNIITQTAFHNFDYETWNILDKLFHSLEVYIDCENDVQTCLKAIILYKVLHDEDIPAIVETKLLFDTFKTAQKELNKEQQNKIFSYLVTFITNKIQGKLNAVKSKSDLIDAIRVLHDGLVLLKDWNKDLKEYTFIRNTIRELLTLKIDNSWQVDLSSLYNVNKSWRKYLFEESLILSPSEEVCLNTLKHDPQLLARHSAEVNALKADISLQRFLSKLRIYWSDTFAQQWTQAYLDNINNGTKHKAIIKGLFLLLPQKQLIDIAKEYVPQDAHINWDEIDRTKVSLSKTIGTYLHIARPLTPLDVILWFAKGDYLKFTVSSLDAILYNMSQVRSRAYIPELLDAPVSLQKYGLHFAFMKLKYDELKPLFLNIWQTTKNLTIRERIFSYTYKLLCKATNPSNAKDLWDVLSVFIDNLSPDDNKDIFKQLGNPKNVHISVRGEFYMKSYSFLASLPAAAECDTYKDDLIQIATNNINILNTDFVADQLLAPIEDKISESRSVFIDIMSAYVLHGKTEDEQVERFRRVMVPAFEHIIFNWNISSDMRENLSWLLRTLTSDFLSKKKGIIVPVKLFLKIKQFLEANMSLDENYVLHTSWRLTLEYVKLVVKYQEEESEEEMHTNLLLPELGCIFTKILKEDTEKYFPSICFLFSEALDTFFSNLELSNEMKLEIYKNMLVNEDFVPSYILACNFTDVSPYTYDTLKDKLIEIRRILSAHPSQEVQKHRAFADIAHILKWT